MNILKKIVYFPIEVTLLGLLVGVSLFAYSHQMTDTQILPKWLISCLVAFVIGVIGPMKKIFRIPIGFSLCHASRVIFVCCIVQSLYFLYLYAGSHMQHVSGSFDNPAGFASAMCAGFPFALYVTKHWKLPRFNWLMWGGVLLMVVTTVLSGSRSGLLGIFVVAGLWTWQAIRCSGKLKTVLLCAFFIVMLVVCYFIRKDSADGRLLIWQCSWEMIKDAPITGYGVGGFKKHYMDYQAQFFQQHPESDYGMLADNVSSPFNEYLNLLIHFGVVGFIVVLILLGIVIIGYKKQPTEGKKIALFSLSGIGVFSMFSYPFSYPFIWIVSCLNFSFFCTGSFVCRIPYLWKKVCLSAVVLCSIVGIWKVTERIWAEVAWNKVAYISVPIKLTDYERLMDNFSGNPYFLYNYAVNLLQNNLLDESLHVAERCRMYWADYDLELLLGDLYGKKGKSDLAEWHYKKAARMCPCRFIPLYELMELYKQNGEHEKMREVIRLILNKPVKVDSSQVQFIKNRANSLWKFL